MDTGFLATPAVAVPLAAALSAVAAVFAARVIVPRVRPAVPRLGWQWAAGISAALAATATWQVGISGGLIAAALIPLLVLSSYIDVKTLRIPNLLNLVGLFVVIVLGGALAATGGWVAALFAIGAGAAMFVVLTIVSAIGGFGMGDVKLAGVFGAALILIDGTLTPETSLLGVLGGLTLAMHLLGWLCASFMIGAVWLITRLAFGKRGRFPFGPSLAIGWVLAVIVAPIFVGLAGVVS